MMCGKCGQYGQGDGGIGCICGKVQCKGCGHYTEEAHGPYCFICEGEAKRREASRADGALFAALRAFIPELKSKEGRSEEAQALLKAWKDSEKFREQDRKTRAWFDKTFGKKQ